MSIMSRRHEGRPDDWADRVRQELRAADPSLSDDTEAAVVAHVSRPEKRAATILAVRLDEDEMQALQVAAAERGVSPAGLARTLLAHQLEQPKDPALRVLYDMEAAVATLREALAVAPEDSGRHRG